MPQSKAWGFGLALLVIAAQAAALRLVDVRRYAWYEHYVTWQSMLANFPVAAAVLLSQVIVLAILVWRYRVTLRQTFGGLISLSRLLLIMGLAGFSLVVPVESVTRVFGELALAGTIALISLVNVVLVALALPDADAARIAAWIDERISLGQATLRVRRWDLALPFVMAAWVAVIAAAANYIVLEHVPHIDDSVSNLFHAKYFAAGHLYLPASADFESFRMDLTVVRDGKWFGYAFPGWPAALAIGVLAGAPWLVNPLLGGSMILLTHAWTRRRYDHGTANLTVLILAASSWLIFTSAEMMGHPLTATLVLLALVAFDRATKGDAPWVLWSLVAGAAVGLAVLTRAFDGILLAGALAVITLIEGRVIRAWRAILTAGLVSAAVGALILPYNQAVTGSATYPAHVAWADEHYGPGVDVLGFGPNVGISSWPNLDPLPGHGPADVVLNLNKNLFMVNIDLFGWPMGSLVFLWLAMGLGRWNRADAVTLAVPAIYIIGYSAFYFSGGPDLGARYWYPILAVFALLSARGIHMVRTALRSREALSYSGTRVGAFIVMATVSAAGVMLPWRAATKSLPLSGSHRRGARTGGVPSLRARIGLCSSRRERTRLPIGVHPESANAG